MSGFEIEEWTPSKLTNYESLSDKDKEPGANNGVKIWLEATLQNAIMSMFDGNLRHQFYTRSAAASQPPKGTQRLEGMDTADLPNLTNVGAHVKRLKWDQEFTGQTLHIDYGLGTKGSNLELPDGKSSNFVFLPKEGGSLMLKWLFEAPDVPGATVSVLHGLKSKEVKICVLGPVIDDSQADVEDVVAKPPKVTSIKKGKGGKTADDEPLDPSTPEGALAAAAGLPA